MVMALFLFSAAALSGCSTPSQETPSASGSTSQQAGNSSEVVKISFWTMQLSPTFDDYLTGVIASFESENPTIKVDWVDVPWGDMENKILSAAASKTMPDVANLNPHFAQKLAQLGALADMDTVPA